MYGYVPRYKESIEWSKYIWKKDLENNRIDIYKCINKYNQSFQKDTFNNKFIKFIVKYFSHLLKKEKILINQKNKYILYNEKEFAQSINVTEDIINCIEELGYNWKENHLSNSITSIELPIKHDYDYAVNLIKKAIDSDKNKSYILTTYVINNDEMRLNIYYFSKLFFPDKIGDKYIVNNFINEIWKTSDDIIIDNIVTKIEKWRNISNIMINNRQYNKLLNILYLYNNKIFDERKLLPSINGDFNYIKDLYYEHQVNDEVKQAVIDYIEFNMNGKILNKNIDINNFKNLNIKHYDNNDLIDKINNYLKSNNNKMNKYNVSKIIIKYLPTEDNNDSNNKIFKKYKDIRVIYQTITDGELKNEILETKHDSIWINVGNIL